MTNDTGAAKPEYRLGYTLALWAAFGVICVNLLIDTHPLSFRYWPGWLEVVLYVLVAVVTSLAFTAGRYATRKIANRGRWCVLLWAAAFAAGFLLGPIWGMILIGAATVIGYNLDTRLPLPEPDKS